MVSPFALAHFPRGQAKAQGRIFVLNVLCGRYDLYRCLDQGIMVLRVGKWATSHHVDDLMSLAAPRLSAADVRRVH